MCFFLVSLHIATENLVSGMAVLIEEVKRDIIEREQMRVEQAVPSLMSEWSSWHVARQPSRLRHQAMPK